MGQFRQGHGYIFALGAVNPEVAGQEERENDALRRALRRIISLFRCVTVHRSGTKGEISRGIVL